MEKYDASGFSEIFIVVNNYCSFALEFEEECIWRMCIGVLRYEWFYLTWSTNYFALFFS